MCKDYEEHLRWYKKAVQKKMEAFLKHVNTCQECQTQLLQFKNALGWEMLTTSDEDTIALLSK